MAVKMGPPMRLSPRSLVIGGSFAVIFMLIWMANRLDIESIRSSYPTSPFGSGNKPVKTSRLHYLIPATAPKAPFCAVVVSSIVNRYSIPTMVGYKGEGKYDAKKAHIAKLRTIQRYLHGPAGEDVDDLVLIVDGYDVIAQLPADVMIARYFDLMAKADERLADRYGITVDEAHERDLRQTLLWGADKGCFPPLNDEAQCWAVPKSHLAQNVWGSKTGGGTGVHYTDPIFLNSGTVIGPLGDLRVFIDAVLDTIDRDWRKDFQYRNSDQYWVSKLYARQEVERTKNITGGTVPGLKDNRKLSKPKLDEDDITEYHVTVDAESSFTMTQCWNDQWMRRLKYNNPDNTATIKEDVFDAHADFREYRVQLSATVFNSFKRIFETLLPEERPSASAEEWTRTLGLNTNLATKEIFAFYHNTCSKKHFVDKFKTFWFWPMVKPLLRAAIRAADDPITSEPIDGRIWLPYNLLPTDPELREDFGGIYTDAVNTTDVYIPYSQLCGEYADLLEVTKEQEQPPQQDPPKQDPPKEEPPKEEPPKQDPPQQDPPKEDPPKEESPKEDAPQDPPKEEPPKGEFSNEEPPKDEPPKDEPPKDEPPKDEPPKDEPPKDEFVHEEPPKDEPPKEEPPKEEPPKEEPPKDEPPKEELSNGEPPKGDPPAQEVQPNEW